MTLTNLANNFSIRIGGSYLVLPKAPEPPTLYGANYIAPLTLQNRFNLSPYTGGSPITEVQYRVVYNNYDSTPPIVGDWTTASGITPPITIPYNASNRFTFTLVGLYNTRYYDVTVRCLTIYGASEPSNGITVYMNV
jgi:hypothetical protein